jgi:hypothetical protein
MYPLPLTGFFGRNNQQETNGTRPRQIIISTTIRQELYQCHNFSCQIISAEAFSVGTISSLVEELVVNQQKQLDIIPEQSCHHPQSYYYVQ